MIIATKDKVFNIEKAVTELKTSGDCLKIAVFALPDSVVKQYLLLEITKPTKLKDIASLYRLQNKITNIADVIVLENLRKSKKVLRLLKEIESLLQGIINYIENIENIENQRGQ